MDCSECMYTGTDMCDICLPWDPHCLYFRKRLDYIVDVNDCDLGQVYFYNFT